MRCAIEPIAPVLYLSHPLSALANENVVNGNVVNLDKSNRTRPSQTT